MSILKGAYPLEVRLETGVYNGASKCQKEHGKMMDVERPNPGIHFCTSTLFTFGIGLLEIIELRGNTLHGPLGRVVCSFQNSCLISVLQKCC